MVIQMMVETPTVVAEAPSPAQGETTDSPMPVPSKMRIREKDAAPTAPAMTAPQDTALPSAARPVRAASGEVSEASAMATLVCLECR
jgi:hypothetical protein